MAVSVRMDPLLERELEGAAQRAGLTKSQFIIEAVERALGRKNPHALLLDAHRAFGIAAAAADRHAGEPETVRYSREALREQLQARQDAELADWVAYQAARQRGEAWPPESDTAGGEPDGRAPA